MCHQPRSHPDEFKRDVALLYASQIADNVVDWIVTFSRRYQGGKRISVNEDWLTMATLEELSSLPPESQAEPYFV